MQDIMNTLAGAYIGYIVLPFIGLFLVYLTSRAISEGWYAGRLSIAIKAQKRGLTL
jgi:hypothetical protein